jgi:ABC-2 type transport system ATP-binding protein
MPKLNVLPKLEVSYSNVDFWFNKKKPLFEGFNLNLGIGSTALLGENGAGKSTILQLAIGRILPKKGSIDFLVDGEVVVGSKLMELIGYVPQNVEPIGSFTVKEQVEYAAWLKGFTRQKAAEAAKSAILAVDLQDFSDRKVKTLSGGQARRAAIAMGIVHQPRFLFLDEPTASLDPDQRGIINALIRQLSRSAITFVSTHIHEDLEGTYDNVIVLKEGRIRLD